MSDLKTKPTGKSVEDFLNSVEHPVRRADGFVLLEMMKKITGNEPQMWGPSIIGFGSIHYKYASGRELNWFKTGFSPRKRSLTIYSTTGFEKYKELLSKLGKHKLGKGCLYINKLADVNITFLPELIKKSMESDAKLISS